MDIVFMLEQIELMIDTKRKRHIVGGIFLSTSLFFGGVALTIMTINNKEDKYYEQQDGKND